MPVKIIIAWLALCWMPACFAVQDADAPKQTVRTISSGDMLHWAAGLLVVLAVFFFCVWGMRKLSGISTHGSEKMRVVGALSLGVREKVILLQVGRKQLVLGVTPGRIDALHVLEGEDCLNNNDCMDAGAAAGQDSKFSAIVKQVMKGQANG
ncbi:flagellar biosynthetic protein FliO [Candidatus Methylobacter oryzae]|uniref:Flagellar protein n=1 Tax=Candidatus Methylobacter oryzae TaxID=2497749 RepID=A0ABY3CCZ9_9GAMM|nr:flagellar biosynthetic protein FliO [Candidatus Methylobacter oryzae]TRX00485.1 flagellar biosynthetic protein FliO [Candidatus Methylobacter oryzae]